MKLTSENVELVFKECLFKDGENTSDPKISEGIQINVGFHKERLNQHRKDISEMLSMLPATFHKDGGGGMSFLNACDDSNGNQWTGMQQIMEQLFLLGQAIGKVKSLMPKYMWNALPGGVPYYVVDLAA